MYTWLPGPIFVILTFFVSNLNKLSKSHDPFAYSNKLITCPNLTQVDLSL